jgi:hypothetical protein
MPGALTLEFAGPNVLKYTLSSGGDAERTQAQMVADCVQGPLRTLLASAQANGVNWQAMPQGPRLDLSIRPSFQPGSGVVPKAAANFTFTSTNVMVVTSDSVGPASVVTVRFVPTPG